jgi:hypothetical protein
LLTIQLIIIAFRGSIRSAPQKTSATLLDFDHQGAGADFTDSHPTTIARAISRNDVPYRA